MPAVTVSTLIESVAANRIGALAGVGDVDERVHAESASTAQRRRAPPPHPRAAVLSPPATRGLFSKNPVAGRATMTS